MSTIAELLGTHTGEDVYVVGSGTSLAAFDWSRLAGRVTIAVNDAAHAPRFRPTYHLWADSGLYERYLHTYPETIAVVPWSTAHLIAGRYAAVATYTHIRRTERVKAAQCDPRWPEPYGRLVLPSVAVAWDSDELFCLHTVATAGIQFAAKLGARRIFLLGCDAYTRERGTNGNNYFDGRRSAERHDRPVDIGGGRYRTSAHIWWDMELWRCREWFEARNVYRGPWPATGVYNCSAESTLTAWQKVGLDDAIGGIQWQPHYLRRRATQHAMPSLT